VDGPSCPACGAALRQCPVCGSVIAAAPRRGRPKTYCSPTCRWRAGHVAARARARARAAESASIGDLPTWDELAAFLATLDPAGLRAPAPEEFGLQLAEEFGSTAGRAGRAGPRIGNVPESAAKSAERKALARAAERRRQAVGMLQVAECGCRYAISVLSNGTGPEEARGVAMEMAAELTEVAEALRRLTRLSGPERRALAVQLSGLGVPTRRVAAMVGVCERSVRYYVAGRRS
jgi:hypothetical protein